MPVEAVNVPLVAKASGEAALVVKTSGGNRGFCQICGQPEKIQPTTIKKISKIVKKLAKAFLIILAIISFYQT